MVLSVVSQLLLILARSAGLLGALTAAVLWAVFIFFNPYYSPDQGFNLAPYATAIMMILLAVAAAWATLHVRPLILLVAFVGSFAPAGFYVLLTPSIFKWIGVADLLYLIALLFMGGARLASALGARIGEHRP